VKTYREIIKHKILFGELLRNKIILYELNNQNLNSQIKEKMSKEVFMRLLSADKVWVRENMSSGVKYKKSKRRSRWLIEWLLAL
jgi:hypothetical protein